MSVKFALIYDCLVGGKEKEIQLPSVKWQSLSLSLILLVWIHIALVSKVICLGIQSHLSAIVIIWHLF